MRAGDRFHLVGELELILASIWDVETASTKGPAYRASSIPPRASRAQIARASGRWLRNGQRTLGASRSRSSSAASSASGEGRHPAGAVTGTGPRPSDPGDEAPRVPQIDAIHEELQGTHRRLSGSTDRAGRSIPGSSTARIPTSRTHRCSTCRRRPVRGRIPVPPTGGRGLG